MIQSNLVLGDVTFDLLLADEDAKLPLNTLYHHVGLKKTEDSISRIAGSHVDSCNSTDPGGGTHADIKRKEASLCLG